MNYKSYNFNYQFNILDIVSAVSQDLNHKNNRIYISKIGQEESYKTIDNFPDVIKEIDDINKDILEVGVDKAIIFKHLKKIDKVLMNSPSPHPDDLTKKFLPTLLCLINKSIDEDAKTISLKFIVYTSLSSNEEITKLYDDDMIQSIINYVSLKKQHHNKSYTINSIYSYAILYNILNCTKEHKDIYDAYMRSNLLQTLNDKLSLISSSQESKYIFLLITRLLEFTNKYQKDILQYIFIIPSLLDLIKKGIEQKRSLKCLYIFLQDYECLKECASKDLPTFFYDIIMNNSFRKDIIYLFIKCINVFCSDGLYPPLNDDNFYYMIIKCIESSGSDDIHEIFSFFLKVIKYDMEFDQNTLIEKTLDVVDQKDFAFKTECAKFFISLFLDSILKVSNDDLTDKVAFYLLNTAYQLHEECLNGCLHVIDLLLLRNNQLSEKILADPEFFVFLDECSTDQTLDEESISISTQLLSKYK